MEYDEDLPQDHPSWHWNEGQWQDYLGITDTQIERFDDLYRHYEKSPERLDCVAREMGWLVDSWEAGEILEGAEDLPYTLHLHPVYTATRSIFKSLRDLALSFVRLNGEQPLLQMAIFTTLHEAQTQALLGLECQDVGDMRLTICHTKRALAQLNHALKLIGKMQEARVTGAELFAQEAKKRIFDLRELWLRVNGQIRADLQRYENEAE